MRKESMKKKNGLDEKKKESMKKKNGLDEKKKELTDEKIKDIILKYKNEKKIRIYTPVHYFRGLSTKKHVIQRLEEFIENKKNNYNYHKVKFETDKIPHSSSSFTKKKSRYTNLFNMRFVGEDKKLSDKEKAKLTGVPLDIIQKVKKKGYGAYSTGHRPFVTNHAWANGRVNSFLTLGCTALSSDESLLQQVYDMEYSKEREKFFNQPISCNNKKWKIPDYLEKKKNKYMKQK